MDGRFQRASWAARAEGAHRAPLRLDPPLSRDTDTMVASLFRAVGLSFKDVGFMKFNLWSPPMAAAAHYSLIMYLKSPISTTVLEKMPVSVDKVRCPLA